MLAFGLQATLLLKALSYDANITRFSEIRVAVVYSGREDEDVADGFIEGFGGLKNKKVKDIPISATKVKMGSALSGYQVIYIASSKTNIVRKVLPDNSGVISATPYPDMVSSGIALGLGEKDGSPKIWVNLDASADAGCKFSSDFLRLAEVVD
ncbi:MAG: YfiR family protein [candidate division WOR-3 bacterium]